MTHIVYLTLNTKNRKIYVGVHSTENPEIFDNYLGCGVYANKTVNNPKTPFQYAVKKYGFKAFERIVLFKCSTKEEALEIEASIVTEEFLKRRDVYNAIVGGGLPPVLNKEICQYSLDGKFIRQWYSVEEASKALGSAFSASISNAAAYKTVSFGYLWSFDKVEILDLDEYKNTLQKIEVSIYKDSGEYIESFESLSDLCRKYDFKHTTTISDAIKSGRKYKNYYFSTKKVNILEIKKQFTSNSKVYQYDLEGNFLKEFLNPKEVRKELGVLIEGLSDHIYKNLPFLGYRWSDIKVNKLAEIKELKTTSKGKKIGQYTQDEELVKIYTTVRECRKDFGNVSKVLRGVVSHCKGFMFKYIEE